MNTIALLQAGGSGAFIIQILPIAAIFLVFYFIVIAPANKQRKKTQEMLSSLKKGDRVVTNSGLHGRIHEARGDTLVLEISSNAFLTVDRDAVKRRLEPAKEEAGKGA